MNKKVFLLLAICFLYKSLFTQQLTQYVSTNPCNSITATKDKIIIGKEGYVYVCDLEAKPIKMYSINSSSSDYNVYAVLYDKNGNIWAGTSTGIKELTENKWKDFSDSIGYVKVNAILQDKVGNIWCATENGLSKYNGKTWTNYPKMCFISLAADNSGNIWAGTYSSGFYKFDGKQWTDYFNNYGINTIKKDSHGNLWFGTNFGVTKYNGTTWERFEKVGTWYIQDVYDIVEDKNNNIWLGSIIGLIKFDGSNWTRDTLINVGVSKVIVDSIGNIWANGYELMKFDGSKWNSMSIISNEVNNITFDKKGNTYFATQSGISKFNGTNWEFLNEASGLANDEISCVAFDKNDNLWTASYNAASKYENNKWTYYTTSKGLIAYNVSAIAFDTSGNAWIGTYGGLSKFDGNSWTSYKKDEHISNITIDKQDHIWVGTTLGYEVFDGNTWNKLPGDNKFIAKAFSFDTKGNTWIGDLSNGVIKYDGNEFIKYDYSSGFEANKANAINLDKSGNLWFGTDNGLKRFDGEKWISYADIIGSNVTNINSDLNNILWISTNNSVYKYKLGSEKNITSFYFKGINLYEINIDTILHEINIAVPILTDLSNLIACFRTSPHVTVKIDSINQYSGITLNNFNNPIKYKIIAEDASSVEYNLHVTKKEINKVLIATNEKDISLYPNPASSVIRFNKFNNLEKICISDLSGKLMLVSYLNEDYINISKLKSGEYIISFIYSNKVLNQKFIKK